MNIVIHTDGGARGNPGPAAIGVLVEQDGKTLAAFGKKIGETTNNVAEYTAVVEALKHIKKESDKIFQINFFLDSRLVVEQLNGRFKVKEPRLRELLAQVRILEQEIGSLIHYHLVPREQNTRADFLVNQALDSPHVS